MDFRPSLSNGFVAAVGLVGKRPTVCRITELKHEKSRLLKQAGFLLSVSDYKLPHVVPAENNGFLNIVQILFKGFIFHLDAGVAVIADVGQGRNIFAPIHIAQAGELGDMYCKGVAIMPTSRSLSGYTLISL